MECHFGIICDVCELLLSFSIIISFIDKSILEINKKDKNATSSEESVLEKLLKMDKRVAIVMALDMLMAGVDTVGPIIQGVISRYP